jgi:hypothetical protein
MSNVPSVPGTSSVALPPWLQKKEAKTDYASMMISAPSPIRASVNKKGEIEFKTAKGTSIAPVDKINGVLMAFGRPRSFWKESGSTEGKAPDCKSADGVSGRGQHIVEIGAHAAVPSDDGKYIENNSDASIVVERSCSSCPHALYGSGNGNSQACKQTIRLGLYVPTHYPAEFAADGSVSKWGDQSIAPWWSEATKEQWPATPAPPLIVSISPTGIKEFEAYLRWMESNGAPMEAYWTTIKGDTKTFGQYTVGVPTFEGAMMEDGQEWYYNHATSLKDHAVVADIQAPGSSEDYPT